MNRHTDELKAIINEKIKANGNRQITGVMLNDILKDIIDSEVTLEDFDPNFKYKSGDYTVYENALYKSKIDENVGVWNAVNWDLILGVENAEFSQQFTPPTELPANVEHTINLNQATKANTVIQVSVEGLDLSEVDTTTSGNYGFSHTIGTTVLKVRVPYTIATNEKVRIIYK